MKIYADNAATTRVRDKGLGRSTDCYQEIYGNPSSLHTPGQRAAEKLAALLPVLRRFAQSYAALGPAAKKTTEALLPELAALLEAAEGAMQ